MSRGQLAGARGIAPVDTLIEMRAEERSHFVEILGALGDVLSQGAERRALPSQIQAGCSRGLVWTHKAARLQSASNRFHLPAPWGAINIYHWYLYYNTSTS